MAVRLRLTRRGKKKQPTYRIVAADSRFPRDGRFIEILGTYDPRQEPSLVKVDNDKALKWLKEGAQPSERVKKLLVISGAWKEFTGEEPPPYVPSPSKKSKKQARAAEEPDADAEAATADEAKPDAAEAAPADATAASEDAEAAPADAEPEAAEAEEPAAAEAEPAAAESEPAEPGEAAEPNPESEPTEETKS